MKIIFAGTPDFAAQSLAAIATAGHEIALVLTQPDRPAGRGMALQASPVKKLAQQLGVPTFQPPNFRDPQARDQVAGVGADVSIHAPGCPGAKRFTGNRLIRNRKRLVLREPVGEGLKGSYLR